MTTVERGLSRYRRARITEVSEPDDPVRSVVEALSANHVSRSAGNSGNRPTARKTESYGCLSRVRRLLLTLWAVEFASIISSTKHTKTPSL